MEREFVRCVIRSSTKKKKRISRKREQKAGKDIGGKAHAASGSLWYKKGDASNEAFLIEDKYTAKDYYSVSLSTLKKIEGYALNISKIPVLRIGFEPSKDNYAVLRGCDCSHLVDDVFCVNHSYKSKRFKKDELLKIYVKAQSDLFMFKLTLMNDSYYFLTWKNFVVNINKFLE